MSASLREIMVPESHFLRLYCLLCGKTEACKRFVSRTDSPSVVILLGRRDVQNANKLPSDMGDLRTSHATIIEAVRLDPRDETIYEHKNMWHTIEVHRVRYFRDAQGPDYSSRQSYLD